MVTVEGNDHGDPSSNPRRLSISDAAKIFGKHILTPGMGKIMRQTEVFNLAMVIRRKTLNSNLLNSA